MRLLSKGEKVMRGKFEMLIVLLLLFLSPLAMAQESMQGIVHQISLGEWGGVLMAGGLFVWRLAVAHKTLSQVVENQKMLMVKVFNAGFVTAESPLEITPEGVKVANEINIDETINNHWEKIKKIIDKSKAKSLYDIQEKSASVAFDLKNILTDAELTIIQNFAYKQGISHINVFSIFGIKIRDRVFKERNL